MTATLDKQTPAPGAVVGPPAAGPGGGPTVRGSVQPPPVRAERGTALRLATALALLGAVLLGFIAYLTVLSPLQQNRMQINAYKTFADELSLAVAPINGVLPAGEPVAVVQIPRLGLTQVVLEGTASGTLMNGPGHRRDTVLPGQAGVSVILGRSRLFGAPFAELARLAVGDEIRVTTGQGVSTFAVTGVRDSTQPIPVPSAAAAKLTLSTASPPLSPDRSLIVSADGTGDLLPGSPTLSPIGDQERSLAGDPAAVLPLMLWGQALLLVAVGSAYLYVRWSRSAAYLVCAPVLLAVLWNLYENAAQLLPNTM